MRENHRATSVSTQRWPRDLARSTQIRCGRGWCAGCKLEANQEVEATLLSGFGDGVVTQVHPDQVIIVSALERDGTQHTQS